MHRYIPPLIALALAACGGGSPAGPSSPTPAPSPAITAQLVDGVTGAALGTLSATTGAPVTVERPGYLRRDTRAAAVLALWPDTVSEAWVRALVYTDTERMMRWPSRGVTVPMDTPDAVLAMFAPQVNLARSADPVVTVTVNPADPDIVANGWAGLCRRRVNAAGELTRADIVLRVDRQTTLLHEMGHAMGLGHSPRAEDLMFPTADARTTEVLSPAERVILQMVYAHRRAGQVAPDDDRALPPAVFASVRDRVLLVGCP